MSCSDLRRALLNALLMFIVFGLGQTSLATDGDLTVLPKSIDGHRPSEMMPRYLSKKVHEALNQRKANYEKLKTPEDIHAHQKKMREFFLKQLGPMPERTPLNPKVVDRLDRDGYRIEKIIYESRPGFFVTALLYLPKAKPPYPGVLVPCGHTGNGKAGYQEACILLARNGMAALCYDPIDQGERSQVLKKNKPAFSSTRAHNRIGVGSILLGQNTATFRVWDGMRSLDYLMSRKEVDPTRIGCTGNSGGGTMTAYLMALDDRIKCAAPSCYLTNLGRLLDTIGPQDAEQHIHAQIGYGMDHADYIHIRAPRPTLMCTATHDFFDITGSWDTFREAKRLYGRLGYAERVDLIETDNKHGFTSPLRVGAVRWMRRWLLGVDDAVTEPEPSLLSDKEARCTPKGQVVLLDGAKTTYDLNREYNAQLAARRKALWNKDDHAEAIDAVRRVTGIRRLVDLPQSQEEHVGSLYREDYINEEIACNIEKLVFYPEPGIRLPGLLFFPDNEKPTNRDYYLYLDDRGMRAAVAPDGPVQKLLKKGFPVLAVDVRGVGETYHRVIRRLDYAKFLGQQWDDYMVAYLLGNSYLKMRSEDILICARWLADREAYGNRRRIYIIATGVLGPPALHAAALEPELISGLTLHRMVVSWTNVVGMPWAKFQYVNVVHGALIVYDLPDLVASLPKGRVKIVDPRQADGKSVNKSSR